MSDPDYSRAKCAMDYPHIPDDKWFAWVWNGLKWPEANRHVGYLTGRTAPMNEQHYLFSSGVWQNAKLFDSLEEAYALVDDHPSRHNIIVSDVWYMRQIVGYEAPEAPHLAIERTNRGFAQIAFPDRNETACRLIKSNLATEDCIWFGAQASSMHLTREHVIALLPMLKRFAETGELE